MSNDDNKDKYINDLKVLIDRIDARSAEVMMEFRKLEQSLTKSTDEFLKKVEDIQKDDSKND